jgi:HK97 family phage prohead protease
MRGKVVPLHWDHQQSSPDAIVGYVNPFAMRESKQGLVVAGKVDLDTERGQQVWRLMRANSVGFSFGFLMGDAHTRSDGVREIRSVDVFEVSVTARPANDGTRVLGLKSISPSEELRRRCVAAGVLPGSIDTEQPRAKSLDIDTRPITVASFEC